MNIEAKRGILRRVPYGLYVLGVRGPGLVPHMTLVSWLMQVAVEPPMVAVAIRRETRTLDLVRWSGAFAISVLGDGSADERLAARLGRATSEVPDKLAGVELEPTPVSGAPRLAKGLGWLDCRVVDQVAAGDHVLFVAEVTEAGGLTEGDPLLVQKTGWRYGG